MLTLFTAQLCRVHRLAQHLDGHGASLLQSAVFLIILLQQTLGTGIVGASTGGLPAAVVS